MTYCTRCVRHSFLNPNRSFLTSSLRWNQINPTDRPEDVSPKGGSHDAPSHFKVSLSHEAPDRASDVALKHIMALNARLDGATPELAEPYSVLETNRVFSDRWSKIDPLPYDKAIGDAEEMSRKDGLETKKKVKAAYGGGEQGEMAADRGAGPYRRPAQSIIPE